VVKYNTTHAVPISKRRSEMKRTQKAGATKWAIALLAVGTAGVLLQPIRAQSLTDSGGNALTDGNQVDPGGGENAPPKPQCQPPGNAPDSDGQNAQQSVAPPRRSGPPPSPEEMMFSQLDLTAEQQAQAQTIFSAEREQMRALHEQTRQRLAALLTTTQLQQLRQMQPPPPPAPPEDTQKNDTQNSQTQGSQPGSAPPGS
jgi:hypothetical protein